ncbi:MAG TPA: hypothetical protein VMM38_00995 [Aridibacter sp.]|nr:hypothetical protein [Aridibacter sp.]
MKIKRTLLAGAVPLLLAAAAIAQSPGTYRYEAQKAFIPPDLGEVYLGMPFHDFVKKFYIKDAEADTRFEFISLNLPFKKGVVDGLTVRVHGFTREQTTAMSKEAEVTVKTDVGDYTRKEVRIDPSKIDGDGFVYALYIGLSRTSTSSPGF